MSQPVGKVPYKTQQAQYELNIMLAKTFGTAMGKKTLEYMKQMSIYKKFPTDRFTTNGQPLLNYEAGMCNFVLDIMNKIEQAKQGPPTPPEGEKDA